MANIFRTASLWLKIAMVCMLLGLLLFVIGFATPTWKDYPYHRSYGSTRGLWQLTSCDSRQCRTYNYYSPTSYHQALQAMECLGLIGFFLATLTLLLYLCADSARRRDFLQAATGFTFGGLLFAGIGFALAAGSNRNNEMNGGEIGWSFGIAIAGAIFYGVSGIMLILQLLGC